MFLRIILLKQLFMLIDNKEKFYKRVNEDEKSNNNLTCG